MGKKINLRFNREETHNNHQYLLEFSVDQRTFGNKVFDGYIKCKLFHGEAYSIVAPDQIFMDFGDGLYWYQPFYFCAPLLTRLDDDAACTLWIDLASGASASVNFSKSSLVSALPDKSFLYKCKITTTQQIYKYYTGRALLKNDVPFVQLYHHTSHNTVDIINKCKYFKGSDWNIQGTKKLKNISYLYLTSIPKIKFHNDLTMIAMASNGAMHFRLDTNISQEPDLSLRVYRESTENRRATISSWVDTTTLSSQPIYRHTPYDGHAVHYEVVNPFIQRLGITPGTTIDLAGEFLNPASKKAFDYIIVGDCLTAEGLRAPFDEEDTNQTLKVQSTNEHDLIDFWFSNPNQNHFEKLSPELAVLSRP